MIDLKNKKITSMFAGVAAAGVLAATVALAGCAGGEPVAATVNGEEIPEAQITEHVQDFREANGFTDDATWAQWLVDANRTPAEMREDAIDYYVDQLLVEQEAKKQGVEAPDSEIDQRIAERKEYYGMTDEQFLAQIEAMGYDEESYRASERQTLLQEKLSEKLATDNDAAAINEDILSLANSYASILDGAKRISVIAMSPDTDASAAVAEVKAPGADFAAVAKKFSTTSRYDGWDVLTTQDQAVIDAIVNMNAGDISDSIVGVDEVYIVKVEEVLALPENPESPDAPYTNVAQIPEDIRKAFEESAISSSQASVFTQYLMEIRENANIVINPMPEKLPYDVSLEGIEPTPVDDSSDVIYMVDEEGNMVVSDAGEVGEEVVADGEQSISDTVADTVTSVTESINEQPQGEEAPAVEISVPENNGEASQPQQQ